MGIIRALEGERGVEREAEISPEESEGAGCQAQRVELGFKVRGGVQLG